MSLTQSAGKRVQARRHNWFGFTSDWIKKKSGARVFLSQSCGAVDAKPITFDTQAKTALCKGINNYDSN